MEESKLYRILSLIHLIFVLSIVCFGTIFLSLTILLIPSITAAFAIGKDLIENKFNVHDGLVKRFFKELKHHIGMMRYIGIWIMILLQFVGIIASRNMNFFLLQVLLLIIAAFLLTFLMYLCVYSVFLNEKIRIEEVLIRMFYKVGILISLFALHILLIIFLQLQLLPLLLLMGTLLLLIIEAAIYYTIYKKDTESEIEE